MPKSPTHHTGEKMILAAALVSIAALGFTLGNGQGTARTSRPVPQRSDQKTIERKQFPNEPFRFGDLKVKNVTISPREKFSASSIAATGGGQVEDWIDKLSFTIKNTSNKRITYINIELDFPETSVNGPMMVYNQLAMGIHPKALENHLKHGAPLALEPGDSTTFVFSPEHLQLVRQFLADRNFQLADLNDATIRIDQVIFDDATKWSQGYDYRPNPNVRGGYERIGRDIK